MFEKLQAGEKSKTALNLQPSNLRLNAYRNLPAGQSGYFLPVFHVFIFPGTIESDYYPEVLIVEPNGQCFKALQHKCRRSVGHQVLQSVFDLSWSLSPSIMKVKMTAYCLIQLIR